MKPIGIELARRLIDFTGTADRAKTDEDTRRGGISASLAESQLKGSVAAHNMLARNRVAYIADEVGLGKTYVALGVMGLMRHFRPNARILVLAPRENIQNKWERDFGNFVRNNWRVIDNRVKSVQGAPARDPVVCGRLADFVREISVNANRDFFLRMTSFSLALKKPEDRNRYRCQILAHASWLEEKLQASDAGEFREQYGRALNALLPRIDLLVVDEAHNLRKGFGAPGDLNTSNRNRVLGLMLGHPRAEPDERYGPRVERVLCLSATPFETDYADLWRQFDVLGKGEAEVRGPKNGNPLPLKLLTGGDHGRLSAAGRARHFAPSGSSTPTSDAGAGDETLRALTGNLLFRRINRLTIGKKEHTKNMYRREWRHGGFEQPCQPIRLNDPRQRLTVALVQKKVAEVLGDERFGNHFQIGMLSSFETFLQTVGNTRRAENEPAFDGRQSEDPEERRGIDTRVLDAIVESYREEFGQEIPHPKLDATVKELARAFETGEKTLVFVRRVATVHELARRLDREFDKWIERRMKEHLPGKGEEIDRLFERFREETRIGSDEARVGAEAETSAPLQPGVDDDPGGRENFFSWFFRGKGPDGVLSGAAFQRNRLSNPSAFYSTLFEDDLVSWLLGRPKEPLACLAARLELPAEEVAATLREHAWAYYLQQAEARARRSPAGGRSRDVRKSQGGGYPRYYVFEAYQAAALHLLAKSADRPANGDSEAGVPAGSQPTVECRKVLDGRTGQGRCKQDQTGKPAGPTLATKADEVLRLRFPGYHGREDPPAAGFPEADTAIGVRTFFTELVRNTRNRVGRKPTSPDSERTERRSLRNELWPKCEGESFAESFRRREQRRELLSAMVRLGGAYIDLYLLAIREAGWFESSQRAAQDGADANETGNDERRASPSRRSRDLACSFVRLLAEQRKRRDGFCAYAELSGAAKAFDTLVKVNFPEAPTASLAELAELFGRGLQEQNPIGRMAGGVAGRTVRQFRMPGFPLVLISTDVLQEGEDLHTFCRRVIHYGITWTPSAMEQRTGRVDRIGGLAQRTLDGRSSQAGDEEKIQVFYPHLEDTVERFQVRRVLRRLDRFLKLVHATPRKQERHEKKIDANREVHSETDIPPPVKELLESAFPVREDWLKGATNRSLHRVKVKELRGHLDAQWNCLVEEQGIDQGGKDGDLDRHGVLAVRAHHIVSAREPGTSAAAVDGLRRQRVELELRSAGIADATFLRCSSVIGFVNPERFDKLQDLQRCLGQPRLCARWDTKHKAYQFTVEASLPFDPATTQYDEFRDLVCRVALNADAIEEEVLGEDADTASEPAVEPKERRARTRTACPGSGAQPKNLEQPTVHRPLGLERVGNLLSRHDDRAGLAAAGPNPDSAGQLDQRTSSDTRDPARGRPPASTTPNIVWRFSGDDDIAAELTFGHLDSDDDESRSAPRPAHGRSQRVRITREGDEYVFTTVVLHRAKANEVHDAPNPDSGPDGGDSIPRSPPGIFPEHPDLKLTPETRLSLRAWRRNAQKDLVNFTLNADGDLVGRVRHPVGHLDESELLLYLQTLATEGDRFEYILTGSDEH